MIVLAMPEETSFISLRFSFFDRVAPVENHTYVDLFDLIHFGGCDATVQSILKIKFQETVEDRAASGANFGSGLLRHVCGEITCMFKIIFPIRPYLHFHDFSSKNLSVYTYILHLV